MQPHTLDRRLFLVSTLAMAPLSALRAVPAGSAIRVASNQGIENAALQQLLTDRGFARDLGLDITIIESRAISGPMDALLADQADVCMVSAFAGILPAIEQGREVRLIGAAMERPALAMYTGRRDIARVRDLAGRTVGIGGEKGLLHILTLALLARKKIDPAGIRFVKCGSNAQVFDAVAGGRVDAGLSGIAGLSALGSVRTVEDGLLWKELPEYTYQPAYASVAALRDRPEAIARCLAAYSRLYRFLTSATSRDAYLAARRRAAAALGVADADTEGEAVWRFVNRTRPYAVRPGLSSTRVDYLQRLNVSIGLQARLQPYEAVVDPRPAIAARRLLG